MVHLLLSTTASNVADALIDDTEETIEMLRHLAVHQHLYQDDLVEEIDDDAARTVVKFLRSLADAIENK